MTGDKKWPPLAETMVQGYLVRPLPTPRKIEENNYVANNRKVGKATLGCFSSQQNMHSSTFCLAKELPVVRVVFSSSGLTALFNETVQLNGQYVAGQFEVANEDIPIVKVNVMTLEGLSVIDDLLVEPPASATPLPVEDGAPGLIRGHLLSGANPEYPAMAWAEGLYGSVLISATVTKAGTVDDPEVVSGPPILQQPALAAVKTYRFTPFLLNGQPVDARIEAYVHFSRRGR